MVCLKNTPQCLGIDTELTTSLRGLFSPSRAESGVRPGTTDMVIVISFTVRRAALAARDFWRGGPVGGASFGAYLASW